jgi:hypothetical protein
VSAPLSVIEDDNLRLAVIDRLMETNVLPPFDRGEFLRGREDDDDRDYEYCRDVADALLEQPITAEQCAAVRELYWEAGNNDIIFTIWTCWGGESDEFTVRSLEGLDKALPNLESLSITICTIDDLSPLSGFTRLRELCLDGRGSVRDLSPLAGLASLRKLELNHLLSLEQPDILRPLAGLRLEDVNLDTGPRNGALPVFDFAPLEHMDSLRTLALRRTMRITGSEPPVATAFDNARVIEVLKARGVKVDVV